MAACVSEISFDVDAQRQERMTNWVSEDEYYGTDVKEAANGDEFVRAKKRHMEAVQILLALLPERNFTVLHNLIKLLHGVAKKQSVNKMSATNLATIFTPNILLPNLWQKVAKHSR